MNELSKYDLIWEYADKHKINTRGELEEFFADILVRLLPQGDISGNGALADAMENAIYKLADANTLFSILNEFEEDLS